LAPADLTRLAHKRWQALVAFARDRSAFYRQLYAGLPVGVPERLDALPVVTKKMIMDGFDQVLTNPASRRAALNQFLADPSQVGRPFAGALAVWASSGTSGEPGVFVHDAPALAVYDALQLFRFRGATAAFDGGPAPFAPGRFALVAATGGHFAGVASVERLRSLYPWMARTLRVFSLMQPLADLVGQLNDYQPDVVATYPTVAAQLALEQESGRLAIAPMQIWTGGECLSAATRHRVECATGAVVREEYGASEFPSIGVGCAGGWLHVNADWVVLEGVDEQYRPVAVGQASHTTLLSNLANRLQPLIRYDLGDSITVRPDACECGNRLPAIRVQGRGDDLLELATRAGARVVLLPLVLTTVLEEGADLYDFQLVQTGPRSLRLHVGLHDAPKAQPARAALERFLLGQALGEIPIELSAEPPVRAAVGGKLRRIVRAKARSRGDAAGANDIADTNAW
jgi:phenylacetate-coenzyme A ligase PaaK-like adenylate-forming protein